MKRTTLAAAIALATVVASAPTASAIDLHIGLGVQLGRPAYTRDYRYSQRVAFDNGYRDGLRAGNHDEWRRDRYGYRDEVMYREGDIGYRREYGPRVDYISSYRRGFEEGYRRGYLDRDHRSDRR